MKKKILAIVLTVVLIFALSACGVSASSSSTTTVSTSVTDSDGNTQTNTVTNEVGISAGPDGVQTTNETTTDSTTEASGSMADLYAPVEEWYDSFAIGAEGETDYGEAVYYAVNDLEAPSFAMLLFHGPDGSVSVRDGDLSWDEEEECIVLYDADMDVNIPFAITEEDEESFVMTFLADDTSVVMYYVDQDTIINDIHEILSSAVLSEPSAEEETA